MKKKEEELKEKKEDHEELNYAKKVLTQAKTRIDILENDNQTMCSKYQDEEVKVNALKNENTHHRAELASQQRSRSSSDRLNRKRKSFPFFAAEISLSVKQIRLIESDPSFTREELEVLGLCATGGRRNKNV